MLGPSFLFKRGFLQKLGGKEIPRHQSRDLAAEEKQRNHKSVNFF